MYFPYFVIISTWTLVGVLNLKKLEFLSPKDALYQVWLKLAQRFLSEKNFLISLMYFRYFVFTFLCKKACIFAISYLPSFVKRQGLSFEKIGIPLPKMLCAKFGWNCLRGSGEEDENVESLRQHQQHLWWRTTDKFWLGKLTKAEGLTFE